jgi:hypothetical protein
VTAAAVVVIVVAALIGATVVVAAVRSARRRPHAAKLGVPAPGGWTASAGDEFSGLSESARCDLIFAIAALDDRSSSKVLERALDDPSEAVVLAAAHALGGRGESAVVDRYFRSNPSERASRIAATLALFETKPPATTASF